MKSQMKAADRSGAEYAVIIGSNELEAGTVVLRPLRAELVDGQSGQQTIARVDLVDQLAQAIQQKALS
jgi:histidyl-tRNA synthetase